MWVLALRHLILSKIEGSSVEPSDYSRYCRCKCILILILTGIATLIVSAIFSSSSKNHNSLRASPSKTDEFQQHLSGKIAKLDYTIKVHACPPENPCYFVLVVDLDEKSKLQDDPLTFHSFFLSGKLILGKNKIGLNLSSKLLEVTSKYNEGGRGLELSELVLFDDVLLTFDDRTGIIFKYQPQFSSISPLFILTSTRNGTKGMKIEWATVKNSQLWIGSFGKEYTDDTGLNVISEDPFNVAIFDPVGQIEYRNWKPIYEKLRLAAGVPFPGYLIHEAINWSDYLKKWIILPRRVSSEPYNNIEDESKGSNILLTATEDFGDIQIIRINHTSPSKKGYSSFKFIPETQDKLILALKSTEDSIEQTQSSFISILETLTGRVLMEDTEIPFNKKFEGIEFVPFNIFSSFQQNEQI